MNGDNIKINVSLRHVDRWAAKDQLTWKSNILCATELLGWYFKTGFICTVAKVKQQGEKLNMEDFDINFYLKYPTRSFIQDAKYMNWIM